MAEKTVPEIREMLRKYDPTRKCFSKNPAKFGSLRQEKIEQKLYKRKQRMLASCFPTL